MLRIPTCMIGFTEMDEKCVETIKEEIESLLVKGVIDKVVMKDNYLLVYFAPVNDYIDFRVSRFIYTIQQPNKYVILQYNAEETKVQTYIKKAPYKFLV